ncbi:MAG TPA: hypothetical protein DEA08_02885, partial [Planctomycetes bacterium]|nr:hypothetical protein [Planctomycetota bacterium]
MIHTLHKVLEEPPRPPSALAPPERGGVPPALERVCLRALSKDPAERYPDGGALAAALRGLRSAGTPAAPRRRRAALLGALCLLGAGALGAWLGGERDPAPPATASARPSASPSAPASPASVADPALAAALLRRAWSQGDLGELRRQLERSPQAERHLRLLSLPRVPLSDRQLRAGHALGAQLLADRETSAALRGAAALLRAACASELAELDPGTRERYEADTRAAVEQALRAPVPAADLLQLRARLAARVSGWEEAARAPLIELLEQSAREQLLRSPGDPACAAALGFALVAAGNTLAAAPYLEAAWGRPEWLKSASRGVRGGVANELVAGLQVQGRFAAASRMAEEVARADPAQRVFMLGIASFSADMA